MMSSKADELKARTKRFALDVLRLTQTLPETDEARNVRRQLIRSGTGVGANYRASCRSRSRAEFIARIGIALEEADESAFWLEIIRETRMSTAKLVADLLQEAGELSAIFARSSITAGRAVDN